jgi:hypothetical protein
MQHVPSPLQTVAKGKSLPDAEKEPTRGHEDERILAGEKGSATAAAENVSREPIRPHTDNPNRNSINFDDNDSVFELTDSDDSSSDESVSSETGTIISVASSTTTVNSDATEAIFRRLLLFQDLRHLWPQLVLRCVSKRMSVLTIERLLRRYCEDLSNLAASTETLKDSDSLVCLTASRFVRRSRLNIANRICEAHYEGKDDYTQADDDIKERIEEATTEMVGSSDDINFVYEISERFLFETEPIIALQSSVKALVASQNSAVDGLGFGLYRSVEMYFSNVVSFIYEPPLGPGRQRLRWKCVSFLSVSLQVQQLNFTAVYHLHRAC